MSIDLIQIAVAIAGAVAGYLFRRPPSPLLPGPSPAQPPAPAPKPLPNHPLLDLLLQLLTERFRSPQAVPPAEESPAAERLPVRAQADLMHAVQGLRQEVAALRAQQPAA